MSGDTFNIHASGSVGKVQDSATGIVNNYGTTSLEVLLAKIVALAEGVRGEVDAPRTRVLDDAVDVIEDRANRDPKELGSSLRALLEIARAAGAAGHALLRAVAEAQKLIGM
ncbi:hypothetical protein ACQEVI_17565 [Promicromonospora sp. CA-289599]|uniref:hypothetical protein n=1 Tax=Promicromonospora sp. CA-289599 TaxID=3240014 RepID=UPI003D8B01AC